MEQMPLLPIVLAVDYRIDQLVVAQPGWRVVFWTGQAHIIEPVGLFALATATSTQTPGLVVSITYTPQAGWVCADTDVRYCGLLRPGEDLGAYEAHDPKGHVVSHGT